MRLIKHCRRCLYSSSHALGLTIDEDEICSGCRIHEEKNTLDWAERWQKLSNLVIQYKVKNGKTYDCIVPVTGGNDSYYIVDIVKNKLGLNPLLVSYNKYFNTPLGIWNLSNLRIKFDCDLLIQNINPLSIKKITRTTLREFGSIYWHCLAGGTVFPVQTAISHGIPLIIWGAHQGLEQVGMFSHEQEVEMTRRYRKDHDLLGYEADDLISNFDVLGEDDIWQFRYPLDADIAKVGVRGIYLGNYCRWDSRAQHEEMIEKYGYRTSRFTRTFDCYDHVDCFNYMGIHDLLKFYKHGYSKVLDHASREIRHGRISRGEAFKLVEKYQFGKVENISEFCQWLGLTPKGLCFMLDRHRNLNFWRQDIFGNWVFNLPHTMLENTNPKVVGFNGYEDGYKVTNALNENHSQSYITIGKGYP